VDGCSHLYTILSFYKHESKIQFLGIETSQQMYGISSQNYRTYFLDLQGFTEDSKAEKQMLP
jgi:hypothetical protein